MTDPEPDEELDIDLRILSIVWSGDDEPRLEISGMSEYEAQGLLLGALRELERYRPAYSRNDEEEDDGEED